MTLEERVALLFKAERDAAFRQLFLQMVDDPDEGDAFFVNACCWTHDPRNDPQTKRPIGAVPFLLWEAQEAAARKIGRAMDQGHELGIEKSRDQGVTWIVLACILRRWLRQQGFSALIGSMTEDLVDNSKSTASLGYKLDFMLERLPAFLRPPGYFGADGEPQKQYRSWMNWVHPVTGATIEGRAPTPKFPVGDRKSVIYYDDWAQWEHGGPAWEAGAATTNCRMASWTVNPEKPQNHAWELRFGRGRFEGVQIALIPVSDLHWSQDPRKTATATDPETGETYNLFQRGMVGDPKRGIPGKISWTQWLRDYEGDYNLVAKGRIYSEQLPYVRVGQFPYDPRFPLYTLWDYGTSDDCVILWLQWDFEVGRLRAIDCVGHSGQGVSYYVPFVLGRKDPKELLEFEEVYSREHLELIARHTGWQRLTRAGERVLRYTDHFGDPAGKQRSISHNKSASQVLADAGIHVRCRDDNAGKGYRGRIEAARFLLPFLDIDAERCQPFLTALQNYQWDPNEAKPLHDEHSHWCAAWEYGCVNLEREIREELKVRAERKQYGFAGRGGGVFGDPSALFLSDPDDPPARMAYNGGGGAGGTITGY